MTELMHIFRGRHQHSPHVERRHREISERLHGLQPEQNGAVGARSKKSPVVTLLEAEEEANTIVAAAQERRRRMARRAKYEAREEANAFRAAMENRFRERLAAQEKDGRYHELEEDAMRRIDMLQRDAEANMEAVQTWLVHLALTVTEPSPSRSPSGSITRA